MQGDKHLMRTVYQTDVTPADGGYAGAFSGTLPAAVFRDGWEIVHVDWSQRGWVEVTFLVPGPHLVEWSDRMPPLTDDQRAKRLAEFLRKNIADQGVYVDDEALLSEVLVDGVIDLERLARAVVQWT